MPLMIKKKKELGDESGITTEQIISRVDLIPTFALKVYCFCYNNLHLGVCCIWALFYSASIFGIGYRFTDSQWEHCTRTFSSLLSIVSFP